MPAGADVAGAGTGVDVVPAARHEIRSVAEEREHGLVVVVAAPMYSRRDGKTAAAVVVGFAEKGKDKSPLTAVAARPRVEVCMRMVERCMLIIICLFFSFLFFLNIFK